MLLLFQERSNGVHHGVHIEGNDFGLALAAHTRHA